MRSKAGTLVLIGAVGNLMSTALSFQLFLVPRGRTIQPMGLTGLVVVIGIVCLVAPSTFSKGQEVPLPEGDRVLKLFGTILCYAALPWSIAFMRILARFRGLSFG